MNPILLGRHVEQGLRELVHATLNTTSTGFNGAVEQFLADPNHFMKGPWVTVGLPFKDIKDADGNWTQPFSQIPLKFAPYIHQSQAFARLSGEKPLSTLVATGTGSGKTESYLWPILDYCRQNVDKPGIKAILIYPMNALATDQARRVASAITNNPALKDVRAGIYADAEPKHATDVVTADSLITRRETMRTNPPDILLTNYKMLDYLLLRGDDLPLWDKNDATTLKFLVVDEMHTFDGAQGADLALLIRRLKHRLSMPKNHLVCIGSSATLGSGEDATKSLVEYAQTIFGESFIGDAVIRETRKTANEELKKLEYFDTPEPLEVISALQSAENSAQDIAAKILATCVFEEDEQDPDSQVIYTEAPSSAQFRLTLGKMLKEHWLIQRVIETIDNASGPISLDDLSGSLAQAKALRKWESDAIKALAEVVVSLLSWARSGEENALRPLFNIRSQVWLREMARMVASLPYYEDEVYHPSTLYHADDVDADELEKMLPVVNCQRCGTSAHIGRESKSSSSYYEKLDTIYNEFFDDNNAGKLRLFYTDKLSLRAKNAASQRVFPGVMHPRTLVFERDEYQRDTTDGKVPAWMYEPAPEGKFDKTCPACGAANSLLLFGIRSTRMTAAISSLLFTSEQNEEAPYDKPRFLLFSDSVQDAAQRGAVTEVRNAQSVIQKALYSAIHQADSHTIPMSDLLDKLPVETHAQLGPDTFTAHFIPRDLTWRRAYQHLVLENKPVDDKSLLKAIEMRMGWSVFEDLTYKSHMLSSLEGYGIASADVLIDELSDTASKFSQQLINQYPEMPKPDATRMSQFIFGVLQRLRRQGSVEHIYLKLAIENSSHNGYLADITARAMLRLKGVMPSLGSKSGIVPRPVSQRGLLKYDNVNSDALTNWFRDWLYRGLFDDELSLVHPRDIYAMLFERLLTDGWLTQVYRNNEEDALPRAYLLKPSHIHASTDVTHFACDTCGRREVALKVNSASINGMRCLRLSCKGTLAPVEHKPKASLLRALNSDRQHRVVAREHTSLLDTDLRLSIEKGFIEEETPWAPNVISATPTLEMGIDIGDLSTLLLCSVPPEEANYVQRMGRTGRRDGNALNFVLANAKPHDLQFWANPNPMLKGEVRAPGVYIAAESVLIRQITAFTLDAYVANARLKGDFGRVSEVRKRREAGHSNGFPMDWLTFITAEGPVLASAFIQLLPQEVQDETALMQRLSDFVIQEDVNSMQWRILKAFDDANNEREKLVDKREELTKEKRKLNAKKAEFTPDEFEKLVERIEKDRKEINRLIRTGIDDVPVIKFLTDRGILPNYAFPEEGVKLTSLLSRRENDKDEDNLYSVEYMRAASSALSEFALGQTFYANGRQVEISRLDMTSEDLTRWRFCPTCSHVENTTITDNHESCPQCGDEMWSDAGSLHDVVELKSVLAISSEDKASIRDNDQRTQLQFDRTMVPEYRNEDISAAWLSKDETAIAPFGYELISRCTFRDFNFGKRADGSVGPRIAGDKRASNPFKICKFCGTHQDYLKAEEQGEHPPSCEVLKNNITEQDQWLSHSFLMRSFDTEAIRVIIPVVGELDNDAIKSFVAAINLGMKHYFAGRVDHIRSAVVEAQIDGLSKVRSLFLYDSVPGGSGYLRQLADNPSAMKAVVQSAFDALDTCPCNYEDKTGCFRCVKSYRSQFGPGEPNRDQARAMMETVLKQWDALVKIDTALNSQLAGSMVDSELESLFLNRLSEVKGWSLTAKVVGDGNRGFLLSTGKGGPSWTIETQVQIEHRFKNMPKKRVDFLLTPVGNSNVKPIVVETDGIKYHAESVTKDIVDRFEMIRSGEVSVWSFAWFDLQTSKQKVLSNPLSAGALSPQSAGQVARAMSHPSLKVLNESVKDIQEEGAFELFLSSLVSPDKYLPAASVFLRSIVGAIQSSSMPYIDSVTSDNKHWLLENPFGQSTQSPHLKLMVSNQKVLPQEFATTFNDIHILVRFEHPPVLKQEDIGEQFISAFRGMWRTVNILQGFSGLHIEFPLLDTLDLPEPPRDNSEDSELDALWETAKEEVIDEYHDLFDAMKAADIPVPNAFGEDLMQGNRIIAMTECGWKEHDVWLSDEENINDERVVLWDMSAESIPETIANVIAKLAKR